MEKKTYIKPGIELIVLDYEISLSMESEDPPTFESHNKSNSSVYETNNPYKTI